MATADRRAREWAQKAQADTEAGPELELLDRMEGQSVTVRCVPCGTAFMQLTPAGSRAAVLPADSTHLGTRYVGDSPKDDTGHDLVTYERVKLYCPCGQNSPSIGARKLARLWLYALAKPEGRRELLWPPE